MFYLEQMKALLSQGGCSVLELEKLSAPQFHLFVANRKKKKINPEYKQII